MNDSLRADIQKLYQKNRRTCGSFSYTIPSQDTYPYQWLWDSCFASIAMSHFDINQAKAELRSLVSCQFKNGMIPHIIYWHKQKNHPFPEIRWGKRRTSSITQPPLLALATEKIYAASKDETFVAEMLPHIHMFHRYLIEKRDPKNVHLVSIVNPDESGEDNSPRFDQVLGLNDPNHPFVDNFSSRLRLVDDWRNSRFVTKKSFEQHHWVQDVPFNAITVESLEIAAHLAEITGNNDIANWSNTQAALIKNAMREYFLRDGLFYSTMGYGANNTHITVDTWALFTPMIASIATESEAKGIAALLEKKDKFMTPFGVPSVAVSEPSFDPSGDWQGDWWIGTNWRGPVWIGANWFIYRGLNKYGFTKQATKIKNDSIQLVKKSGFREYYDPLTGDGHGANGFSWAGLLLDM